MFDPVSGMPGPDFSHQFLLQPIHLLKTGIGSVVVSRQMKESVNQIETELLKQLLAELGRLAMGSFDTDDYLAMLESNYIGRASDLHKLEMNGRDSSVGNQDSYNFRRQSGSLNRLHFFQSALCKSG